MNMTERYYFDTSIWLDIVEMRGYNSEVALKLLRKIIISGSLIVYSEIVIEELKHIGYTENEIHELLGVVKQSSLKRVNTTKIQIQEAIKISKQRDVPYADAIHAIVSRDNEAQLVSRDWHFEKLKDVTRARLPEGLL